MDIAERTLQLKEDIDAVYEAGKEAERKAFWEVYQYGGSRTFHNYAFYGAFWTDETYNPIYTIKIRANNTNAFYQCGATDSKVSIDISGASLNNTFRYSNFVTIRELIVNESTSASTGFGYMSNLENVTISGTIGKSWNMGDSPLTAESLKSMISCLKDYTGTESEYSYTLTLKTSAFEALEAEGATAEYNGVACTWAELIDNKKWNLTLA